MTHSNKLRLLAATTMALALAACGGGGDSPTGSTGGTPPPTGGGTAPAGNVALTLSPSSVQAGKSSALSWATSNVDTCTASGAWSGPQATSGSTQVIQQKAGSYVYTLTCNSANGPVTGSAALTVSAGASNVAALVVDGGPQGRSANQPFVSVTVCQPGTSVCQTVDHIMVDTGSYGLRVFQSALSGNLALPAVTTPSGGAVAECAQFVSGYTWGSVRRADVKIAGETAANIPMEVISDTASAYANVPSSCNSTGTNIGTVSAMGANGILGVGLFTQDCGSTCTTSTAPNYYFSCSGNSCTGTALPLANQVVNPVAAFGTDNRGVVLQLASVPSGGAASVTGTLTFGIDSQANNALGTVKTYKADWYGNFQTAYKGTNYSRSFIDSGSNGLFFPDSSMPKCSSGSDFYCPTSTLNLTATMIGVDGASSTQVGFFLDNVDQLSGAMTAASIGGMYATGFDWGLPFFFGRTVYVVREQAVTTKGTGPFWAF